ncbi:hypothetical protein [Chromobacterium violaceum]|uniref:Uncharacterized protein n=1 Tax=Chromobacterium violaceum TaxID=536 RepID=A0A202B2T7_CHRVL|nr:hypothetical protein [Chromobacterium violaceum]MBA8737338.1 hypothetical protein [Chromobacterium violaceum]MBP4044878.1 hypothetical protein [Chromobacterium violaceum]OVE45836.1 hypothetical protein CBW21_21100 [Chromobacterium violaceum]
MSSLDTAALLDALIQLCHHMPTYWTQLTDWMSNMDWGHLVSSALLTILAVNAVMVPAALVWLSLDFSLPKRLIRRARFKLPSVHQEVKHG